MCECVENVGTRVVLFLITRIGEYILERGPSNVRSVQNVNQIDLSTIFSSPEPKAHRGAYSIPMLRRPSSSVVVRRPSFTISKIFSSETTWPIKAKLRVEHP